MQNAWDKKVMLSSSKKALRQFFDYEFAKWYNLQIKYNNYPGLLLNNVENLLNNDSSLLDIGAGTGCFAIPLSKKVKKVTAIEPSESMIKVFKENINGHRNINIINKFWEEIENREIEKHDVVLAANSLYSMTPIIPLLDKMIANAKKFLCIIITSSSKLNSKLWNMFRDDVYISPPNYLDLYNVLYDMGIFADVKIITKKHYYFYNNFTELLNYWTVRLKVDPLKNFYLEEYLRNIFKKTALGFYYEEDSVDAIITARIG